MAHDSFQDSLTLSINMIDRHAEINGIVTNITINEITLIVEYKNGVIQCTPIRFIDLNRLLISLNQHYKLISTAQQPEELKL